MDPMQKLVTGLALLVILAGFSSGQRLCKIGEILCGDSCYLPGRYQCIPIPNATYEGAKVCRNSEALRARNGSSATWAYCYDPEFEDCHQTANDNIVCLKGFSVCARTCYNPVYQSCIIDEEQQNTSSVLCLRGQRVCGSNCYWPEVSNCLRKNNN